MAKAVHVSPGHPPGYLYGCPACESQCFCENFDHSTPCVFCVANDGEGCRVDENRCRVELAAME